MDYDEEHELAMLNAEAEHEERLENGFYQIDCHRCKDRGCNDCYGVGY